MKKLFLSALCLCFMLSGLAIAAPANGEIIVKRRPVAVKQKPRTKLPEIKEEPFHTPPVMRVVTDNGIEAWLIEEKSTPVIALSVLFKGGKSADAPRLTGLSTLAMSLLDEGAGRYKAEEFTELLERKAVKMSFAAQTDTLKAQMTALRDNKEEAFDLFRLALTKPRFDRKAVRQMKEQMSAAIKARKGNPNAIAAERWAKLVYKDHPYARAYPTQRTLNAITRANLRRLMRDRITRDNMIIGVTGNISAEELKPLLEKTFAGLPEKARLPETPAFDGETKAGIDILSMDVPQSAVLFGHKGLPRDDADFYAALLVNYSFGGGSFASRLFNEVREKNGLAYSVGTSLNINTAAPMFVGSVGSDNAKLADAINIIREEWRKMAENGPTAQELKDAKTYLTGSFPLAFSSSTETAAFLAGMQYYGLGIDYLQRHNDLINAVTLEQAKKTAARLLIPDSLFFVVVGKPANL